MWLVLLVYLPSSLCQFKVLDFLPSLIIRNNNEKSSSATTTMQTSTTTWNNAFYWLNRLDEGNTRQPQHIDWILLVFLCIIPITHSCSTSFFTDLFILVNTFSPVSFRSLYSCWFSFLFCFLSFFISLSTSHQACMLSCLTAFLIFFFFVDLFILIITVSSVIVSLSCFISHCRSSPVVWSIISISFTWGLHALMFHWFSALVSAFPSITFSSSACSHFSRRGGKEERGRTRKEGRGEGQNKRKRSREKEESTGREWREERSSTREREQEQEEEEEEEAKKKKTKKRRRRARRHRREKGWRGDEERRGKVKRWGGGRLRGWKCEQKREGWWSWARRYIHYLIVRRKKSDEGLERRRRARREQKRERKTERRRSQEEEGTGSKCRQARTREKPIRVETKQEQRNITTSNNNATNRNSSLFLCPSSICWKRYNQDMCHNAPRAGVR